MLRSRFLTPLAAGALALPLFAATPVSALIVFAAGDPSHGPGEHRFPAGARLLADAINQSGLPVRTEVTLGWPEEALLRAASSLVLYSDGLDRHVAKGRVTELNAHAARGRGLAVLHFAVEPSPGDLADHLLERLGGRFETEWSVNPLWTVRDPIVHAHEVTRGVNAFAVEDEWYYHLRFATGIVPVLQARPPADTLGQDGPRSGNPAVRAAVARASRRLSAGSTPAPARAPSGSPAGISTATGATIPSAPSC